MGLSLSISLESRNQERFSVDLINICWNTIVWYSVIHASYMHHTYIHAYMHTCIHTSIHPYIHTSIHPYIHPPIHPYIHTSIHPYIHTSIHPYMHTCKHAYMHTCVHTYIHTYLIIYIYINVHMIYYNVYIYRAIHFHMAWHEDDADLQCWISKFSSRIAYVLLWDYLKLTSDGLESIKNGMSSFNSM